MIEPFMKQVQWRPRRGSRVAAAIAVTTLLAGTGLGVAAMPTRADTTRAATPAGPAAPAASGAVAADAPSAPGGSGFANFINQTMGPAAIGRQVLTGDFNGDGHTDIAAVGSASYAGIWVALTNGPVVNAPSSSFAGWASVAGVHALTGDFNGDGKTDIALVPPPSTPWWYTLPVAFSNGDGTFTVTNTAGVGDFTGTWAQTPGVQVIAGDFNGDGKTDIALLGGSGWTSIPVAYSNGDGTFHVQTATLSDTGFAGWDTVAGVHVVTGDFNGDHKADIALLPPPNTPWWYTLPVATSNGTGSFSVVNPAENTFISREQTPGARLASGDFNGDGKTDIALFPPPGTGPQPWSSTPVAFGSSGGLFTYTDAVKDYSVDFADPNDRIQVLLTGDFNGDGKTDVALFAPGYSNWGGIPVATSNGDGSFKIRDYAYPLSPHELQPASQDSPVVTGDFNHDGKTDILSWGFDYFQGPFAFGVFPGAGATYTAEAFVEFTG